MVVKKYADGTYNIFYDKGDFVKVKDVTQYGETENARQKKPATC